MDTSFVTPAEQVDMTVEAIPLTLSRRDGAVVTEEVVVIKLARCGAMNDLDVVDTDGVDRTGLFVWRGSRDFVHLYEAFCRHSVDAAQTPSRPFDSAVELGAGSGLGTLAVAVCTAAAFPAANGGGRPGVVCVATDYWAPTLSLLNESAGALACPHLPIAMHTMDWLHWSAEAPGVAPPNPSDTDCANHLAALDALLGVTRPLSVPPRVWLYGLDVTYPDTRTAVLIALFTCVRQLLQAYHHPCGGDSGVCFSGLFTSTFLSSFVERDAGVTLRRILAACVVTNMEVIPLASPFTSSSETATAPLMEAIPLLMQYGSSDDGAVGTAATSWQACCDAAWHVFRQRLHTLLTCRGDDDTCATLSTVSPLALAVAGTGSWLFAFRPMTATAHATATATADAESTFERLAASPTALRHALERSPATKPWAALLPWLFVGHTSPPLSLQELAVCAQWVGSIADGSPSIQPHLTAQLAAARQAATCHEDSFLFNGFDL